MTGEVEQAGNSEPTAADMVRAAVLEEHSTVAQSCGSECLPELPDPMSLHNLPAIQEVPRCGKCKQKIDPGRKYRVTEKKSRLRGLRHLQFKVYDHVKVPVF